MPEPQLPLLTLQPLGLRNRNRKVVAVVHTVLIVVVYTVAHRAAVARIAVVEDKEQHNRVSVVAQILTVVLL